MTICSYGEKTHTAMTLCIKAKAEKSFWATGLEIVFKKKLFSPPSLKILTTDPFIL